MTESDDVPPPLPDLRVAVITDAREHPNADRLLVLDIDLGEERRQLVAGIRAHYEVTALPGLPIVVVANLEPARLRGEISEGMLLAVEREGKLGLLLAPGAAPGTRLRAPAAGPPAPSIGYRDFQRSELLATPDGVTLNGHPLEGASLSMDREVYGRLL